MRIMNVSPSANISLNSLEILMSSNSTRKDLLEGGSVLKSRALHSMLSWARAVCIAITWLHTMLSSSAEALGSSARIRAPYTSSSYTIFRSTSP